MRIGRHSQAGVDRGGLRAELDEILMVDGRPGSVCGAACQRPDPKDCSRNCPDVPRALSSDPDSYPLEARVAPLVYELKRLGVFEPCWSCEGHNKPDGSFWKLPQVWFYCRSVVHLRVLADGIKELHLKGRLSVPWQVAITYSDHDNIDTTFSLHPLIDAGTVDLAALQADMDAIAAHLRERVFAEAQNLARQSG